jgi:hypothetical protein
MTREDLLGSLLASPRSASKVCSFSEAGQRDVPVGVAACGLPGSAAVTASQLTVIGAVAPGAIVKVAGLNSSPGNAAGVRLDDQRSGPGVADRNAACGFNTIGHRTEVKSRRSDDLRSRVCVAVEQFLPLEAIIWRVRKQWAVGTLCDQQVPRRRRLAWITGHGDVVQVLAKRATESEIAVVLRAAQR